MPATSSATRSLLLAAAALLVGCGGAPQKDDPPPTEKTETPRSDHNPPGPSVVRAPEPADLADMTSDLGEGKLRARLVTSLGAIDCVLFEEEAPQTVANFVGLSRGMRAWVDPLHDEVVERPLYQDLEFHRVIPGFAIQTGDPTGTGNGGPGYTFPDEFSRERRHDKPGVLSMANHGPNTNGSQFFVTEAAVAHLDFRHTVFGECGNLDVVKAISTTPTGPEDRPVDPPVLEKIEIYRSAD